MLHPFTKETAAKAGRNGGRASGRARRRRRTFRELMEAALKTEMPGGGSGAENIVAGIVSRACNGDPRAFQLILDIVGETPEAKPIACKQDFQVVLFGEQGKANGKAITSMHPEIINMLDEMHREADKAQGDGKQAELSSVPKPRPSAENFSR